MLFLWVVLAIEGELVLALDHPDVGGYYQSPVVIVVDFNFLYDVLLVSVKILALAELIAVSHKWHISCLTTLRKQLSYHWTQLLLYLLQTLKTVSRYHLGHNQPTARHLFM